MKLQFLAFLLLIHCTSKSVIENKIAANVVISQTINLNAYQDSLQQMKATPAASLRALEIFHDYFDKQYLDQNDKAFKSYLEFQATLMNNLNDQLVKRPDYEKINSMLFADSKLHEPEGLDLENELNKNGLLFKSTEGMIYIGRKTDLIRSFFFEYLSSSMRNFFNQFEFEENQGLAEDGGLIISPIELAQRIAFWENFLTNNPNHIFSEFAQNNKVDYLQFLMEGMDNTPAFAMDTKKLNPEFLKAYNYMTNNYPNLSSTAIVSEYNQILKKNNYQRTNAVLQFIERNKTKE